MNQNKEMSHFKDNQTGYHRYAVLRLAEWIGGLVEKPFYLENSILFVPDLSWYDNGILKSIYEVVYSHSFSGKKLGLIQYWCYKNSTDLTVYEISADYILAQIEKPEYLHFMEIYII